MATKCIGNKNYDKNININNYNIQNKYTYKKYFKYKYKKLSKVAHNGGNNNNNIQHFKSTFIN